MIARVLPLSRRLLAPRRVGFAAAGLAISAQLVLALTLAPRAPPSHADDGGRGETLDVGPIAYRLLALEPLLVAVDRRAADTGDNADEGPAFDFKDDGRWHADVDPAAEGAASALQELLSQLRAADGPIRAPPRSAHGRAKASDEFARWALVATWEAAALAKTTATGAGDGPARRPSSTIHVVRARRCTALPLPPPLQRSGAPSWSVDLLRPPPPHPDPPESARPRYAPLSRDDGDLAPESLESGARAARRGEMDRARRIFDGQFARDPSPRDASGSPDLLAIAWRAETAIATGGAAQATAWLERAAAAASAEVAAFLLERAAISAWRGGDRRRSLDLVAKARAKTTHPPTAVSLALLETLARAGALDARGDPRLGDLRANASLAEATSPRTTGGAGPSAAIRADEAAFIGALPVLAAIALAAGDERRAAPLLGRAVAVRRAELEAETPLDDARRRTAAWLAARVR